VKPSSLIAGLTTLFVFGCSGQIPLGVEPSLWMADHETGDLSQWKEGGTGDTYASSDSTLTLVENLVHGGRYAVKSSINNVNHPSLARLYRQDLPPEAYFTVWLYFPQAYDVGDYWNVFEFTGRRDSANAMSETALWSLNLRKDSHNQLAWYVYDDIGGQELLAVEPLKAPIGRWFAVTAYVRQATDQTGQLTFWIDGKLFINETGRATVPSLWMRWSVGNVAERMPQPADLFLDDAIITDHRPGR
jgi:hypothetical protein